MACTLWETAESGTRISKGWRSSRSMTRLSIGRESFGWWRRDKRSRNEKRATGAWPTGGLKGQPCLTDSIWVTTGSKISRPWRGSKSRWPRIRRLKVLSPTCPSAITRGADDRWPDETESAPASLRKFCRRPACCARRPIKGAWPGNRRSSALRETMDGAFPVSTAGGVPSSRDNRAGLPGTPLLALPFFLAGHDAATRRNERQHQRSLERNYSLPRGRAPVVG